jgi:GT2 family glycosyltransferase
MTTLSVVIPATDAPETLSRCLAAIRAAAEPPEEVAVVDRPKGTGPASARNLGASRATHDVLVFIDADVEVAPDAFRRIRRAFASDPGLVALFGSYDDDPERHGLISDFRNLLHHHVHQNGAGAATTFWAGLGAVRRDAFLSVGGFDEERFPRPSIEDIDLGMRLTANGSRIVLDPAIQGKHLKRWTLLDMIQTDLVRRGIPWVELLADSRTSSVTLNLAWRHRLSAAASVGLAASLVARQRRGAVVALAALCALNAPFYVLLWRRRGWQQLLTGIPLHAAHHLAGAVAVPAGAAAYLRKRLRSRQRRSA